VSKVVATFPAWLEMMEKACQPVGPLEEPLNVLWFTTMVDPSITFGEDHLDFGMAVPLG